MVKSSRIFSVLNLLTRNELVTLREIREICGVPQRTAYRYLDYLSEAGVPIYFDRPLKAYRLANPVGLLSKTLTDTDVVILAASLLLIRAHLNPQYKSMVESIVAKVCSSKSVRVGDVEAGISHDPNSRDSCPDYSAQVTMAIVLQAIHNRQLLTITKKTDEGKIEFHSLRNAGITFEKGWRLRGETKLGMELIELESILTASTNLHGTSRPIK